MLAAEAQLFTLQAAVVIHINQRVLAEIVRNFNFQK